MEKKLTVVEAAKLLGVSKEAIYNRLRRGTLQSVVEDGVKYIVLTKQSTKESSSLVRKADGGIESAYVSLLKTQLDELKAKNDRLEADKERLIADKEKLLIESKEKIEAIYKERDEQLKTILSLANRHIVYAPTEGDKTEIRSQTHESDPTVLHREELVEEADLLEDEGAHEADVFESYRDWRDLRSYLKEKGFSKKEKQHINDTLEKKLGHADDVIDKNGKLFIKKGKKLKEILGD